MRRRRRGQRRRHVDIGRRRRDLGRRLTRLGAAAAGRGWVGHDRLLPSTNVRVRPAGLHATKKGGRSLPFPSSSERLRSRPDDRVAVGVERRVLREFRQIRPGQHRLALGKLENCACRRRSRGRSPPSMYQPKNISTRVSTVKISADAGDDAERPAVPDRAAPEAARQIPGGCGAARSPSGRRSRRRRACRPRSCRRGS